MNTIQHFIRPSSWGVLGLCLLIFRLFFAYADIEPEATGILKRYIGAEYARYQLQREDISLDEQAERVKKAENIELLSVKARGNPKRIVFRVEIAANVAQPPNAKTIRYFRMRHSLTLGYPDAGPMETDAVGYFLALF